MIRPALLGALVVLALRPTLAAEPAAMPTLPPHSSPQISPQQASPRPAAPACPSLDYYEGLLTAGHASTLVLGGEAVHRAARVFAATPPVEAEPAADRVALGTMPSGAMAALFVEGVRVCHKMVVRDPRMARAMNVYIAGEPV